MPTDRFVSLILHASMALFMVLRPIQMAELNQSELLKSLPAFPSYSGRFSALPAELDSLVEVSGFQEAFMTYKNHLWIDERTDCDVMCRLKAALYPVAVPLSGFHGENENSQSEYRTKIILLKELSELSKRDFLESRESFEMTMKVIDFHLFYRFDEYYNFLRAIVAAESSSSTNTEDSHDHLETEIFESSWEVYLKPVYSILQKLLVEEKADVQDNSFKIEAGFAGALVKLITSPLEEESKAASKLIQSILFEPGKDLIVLRVVMSSLNDLLSQILEDKIPFLALETLLRFFSESMHKISLGPEVVVSKMLSIIRGRLIPLYRHERLHWFHEPFASLLIQYFTNFEIEAGQEVKRTPFQLLFPESTPYSADSAIVEEIRRGLLHIPEPFETSEASHYNQLARFYVMHQLYLFQFYPRAMILDILVALKRYFFISHSFDCASYIVVLFSLQELSADRGFSIDQTIRQEIIAPLNAYLSEELCGKNDILRKLKSLIQKMNAETP